MAWNHAENVPAMPSLKQEPDVSLEKSDMSVQMFSILLALLLLCFKIEKCCL